MTLLLPLLGCSSPQTLTFADGDNFEYRATVDIDSSELPSLDGTSTIRWDDLSADMLGAQLDPSEIDGVQLLVFPHLGLDEVEERIATDSLKQSDVGLFLEATPADGEVALDDFALQGNPVGAGQYFEPGSGTWLVNLLVGEEYVRFHELVPVEGSEETVAQVSGSEAQFDVDATLASSIALTGEENKVDWSELTVDGLGGELVLHRLDGLSLAQLPEVEPSDIEDRFDELESLIGERTDLDISGMTSAELPELAEVDDEGTWLLALTCGSCTSPVPRVMVVLTPQ